MEGSRQNGCDCTVTHHRNERLIDLLEMDVQAARGRGVSGVGLGDSKDASGRIVNLRGLQGSLPQNPPMSPPPRKTARVDGVDVRGRGSGGEHSNEYNGDGKKRKSVEKSSAVKHKRDVETSESSKRSKSSKKMKAPMASGSEGEDDSLIKRSDSKKLSKKTKRDKESGGEGSSRHRRSKSKSDRERKSGGVRDEESREDRDTRWPLQDEDKDAVVGRPRKQKHKPSKKDK